MHWTKKHGKSCFGYKLSANTDKKYKLIRKIKISTADEHDTLHLDDVLDSGNTSRALYYVGDSQHLQLIDFRHLLTIALIDEPFLL